MQPDKAMRGFVRGFFESIPKLKACRPNKPKGERQAVHPLRRGMTVGCVLVAYEPVADSQQLMLLMLRKRFQIEIWWHRSTLQSHPRRNADANGLPRQPEAG